MSENYSDVARHLATRLTSDAPKFRKSASYYDATYRPKAVGVAVPKAMRVLLAHNGWARVYINALVGRMDLERFKLEGHASEIDEVHDWWGANDMEQQAHLVHTDLLIYGRAYVTVSAPGPDDVQDVPIVRAESPMNMIAERDPRTGKIVRAMRLYKSRSYQDGDRATLYFPGKTVFLKKASAGSAYGAWDLDTSLDDGENIVGGVNEHGGPIPVVEFLNRSRVGDHQGCSEITPDIRSTVDSASRISMNMAAAAEIMANPQRVFLGVKPEDLVREGGSVLEAYMAEILTVDNPDAKVTQFQAAELRNYTEVLGELAKQMTSYTGLMPEYFGITSVNPPSADAIRAGQDRIIKHVERLNSMVEGDWCMVVRLMREVMGREDSPEWARLDADWRDPGTPTFSAMADGVQKLYGDGTNPLVTKRWARRKLRISDEEIKEMEKEDQQLGATARLNMLLGDRPDPTDEASEER